MTKNLYLLRHADAEANSNTGQDIDRKLSLKGEQEAGSLSKRLIEKSIFLDIVLCSTAVRVHQTYDHIASELGSVKLQYMDELYNPSLETLLDILKHLNDSQNSVLIISHNPTMSNLASHLTGEDIHFVPGVLKYLQLDLDSWADISGPCAKLLWSIP